MNFDSRPHALPGRSFDSLMQRCQAMIPLRVLCPSLLAALSMMACAPRQTAAPVSQAAAEYAALPDTTVCVLDRSSSRGLREIQAKSGSSGVLLLQNGEIRSLESVHPVNLIAGYAGREAWLTRGDPITLSGRRFVSTGGERRIAIDLLRREGEYQGILLFVGADEPPPATALYVPTAPGCIFQAFVREDLLRR